MICQVFGFVEKYLVVSKSEKGEGEGREGRREGVPFPPKLRTFAYFFTN